MASIQRVGRGTTSDYSLLIVTDVTIRKRQGPTAFLWLVFIAGEGLGRLWKVLRKQTGSVLSRSLVSSHWWTKSRERPSVPDIPNLWCLPTHKLVRPLSLSQQKRLSMRIQGKYRNIGVYKILSCVRVFFPGYDSKYSIFIYCCYIFWENITVHFFKLLYLVILHCSVFTSYTCDG